MEHDWLSPGPHTPTASRACSSMEKHRAGAAGDAGRDPTTDPSKGGSGHSNTTREPPIGGPPASRVGYLRRRYKDCQISEGATRFLLASRSQATSTSLSTPIAPLSHLCMRKRMAMKWGNILCTSKVLLGTELLVEMNTKKA